MLSRVSRRYWLVRVYDWLRLVRGRLHEVFPRTLEHHRHDLEDEGGAV